MGTALEQWASNSIDASLAGWVQCATITRMEYLGVSKSQLYIICQQ